MEYYYKKSEKDNYVQKIKNSVKYRKTNNEKQFDNSKETRKLNRDMRNENMICPQQNSRQEDNSVSQVHYKIGRK